MIIHIHMSTGPVVKPGAAASLKFILKTLYLYLIIGSWYHTWIKFELNVNLHFKHFIYIKRQTAIKKQKPKDQLSFAMHKGTIYISLKGAINLLHSWIYSSMYEVGGFCSYKTRRDRDFALYLAAGLAALCQIFMTVSVVYLSHLNW